MDEEKLVEVELYLENLILESKQKELEVLKKHIYILIENQGKTKWETFLLDPSPKMWDNIIKSYSTVQEEVEKEVFFLKIYYFCYNFNNYLIKVINMFIVNIS